MTPTAALAKLAKLGGTKAAVAASLKRRRIKGNHSACGCPIAKYAKAMSATLTIIEWWGPNLDVFVPTPRPIAAFIRAFDRGEYPELEQ